MSLPPRIGRVIAATFVMCLLVAGCQSNPEPAPLPSPTPSPTPSSSPSPTVAAPTLPPEARGTSTASAKAFVRHYFEAINYSASTGDVSYLRTLGSPECQSCTAIVENIDDIYSAGGLIRTRGWILTTVSPVPGQPSRLPIFDLGVRLSREQIVKKRGVKPTAFVGAKQPMTIYLRRQADSWQVTRLDKVA